MKLVISKFKCEFLIRGDSSDFNGLFRGLRGTIYDNPSGIRTKAKRRNQAARNREIFQDEQLTGTVADKEEAERIHAEIRLAGTDSMELAEITSREWPKEAFLVTETTNVSIQTPKEIRTIIVRYDSAADAGRLISLERQFPGRDLKTIVSRLGIGKAAILESANRLSFESDEEEQDAQAPKPRILWLRKLSAKPVEG